MLSLEVFKHFVDLQKGREKRDTEGQSPNHNINTYEAFTKWRAFP